MFGREKIILKPFFSKYFVVSNTDECSTQLVIIVLFSVTSANPLIIILLLSVDPDVKITSSEEHPKIVATVVLAVSNAFFAFNARE